MSDPVIPLVPTPPAVAAPTAHSAIDNILSWTGVVLGLVTELGVGGTIAPAALVLGKLENAAANIIKAHEALTGVPYDLAKLHDIAADLT